jgi:hypothetical protein
MPDDLSSLKAKPFSDAVDKLEESWLAAPSAVK